MGNLKTEILRNEAANLTNTDGKKFINEYIKEPIIKVINQKGNFFLVVTDEFSYSLPYYNTDCLASHFGKTEYLNKYLNSKFSNAI